MSASQEFRDGAAWGAYEMVERLRVLASLGIDSPDQTMRLHLANQIRYEMGGALPVKESGDPVAEIRATAYREAADDVRDFFPDPHGPGESCEDCEAMRGVAAHLERKADSFLTPVNAPEAKP